MREAIEETKNYNSGESSQQHLFETSFLKNKEDPQPKALTRREVFKKQRKLNDFAKQPILVDDVAL